MKRIYNYILLSVLAFAAAGCVEENFNNDMPSAESGDEVQFGLSLSNPETRTIYGGESNNAFPIYWVDGDNVQIFSPQAMEGRNNAEYKVILPSGVANPTYADDLKKTGEYGVQWGDGYTYKDEENTEHTGVHDFYSIYPSGEYTFAKDADNNDIWAKGVVINSMQNIDYLSTGLVYAMDNCLMYAYTPKVDRPNVANLKYKPLSTVLWFTLSAAALGDVQGYQILGVTLEANNTTTPIAGSFDINLSAEKLEMANLSGSNKITATIYDKSVDQEVAYTLPVGGTISFPIFLAPNDFDINGWKITINTNLGSFTKTLATKETKLSAGLIHKIVLPKLSSTEDWDVSKWMTYIPRNVYLSEVSIPGTWNSLNSDCQSNTSISEQYKMGVRAFHLDTRWKASRNGTFGQIYNPSITALSVCDGSTSYSVTGESGRVNGTAAQTFESCLNTITENVKDDEYMVVFCTFAQDSYNGGNCPSTWQAAVSNACASNDKVYDANNLSANTLVGDVLGKVIVIINLDTDVDSATLPESSKCVFTYVPMNLPANHYETTTSHLDDLSYSTKTKTGISMYTSHAQISTTGTSSVNCGDRGYSHPLTNRDALVTSFWDWSRSNYGTTNYKHDKWVYLGLGGYIMTSSSSSGSGYDTIENRYAPMVYNRVNEMGKNNIPYYPIGIVLMNNKKGGNYTADNTDLGYGFKEVCKAILMLNNKYRLQYDSSKQPDYNPTALSISDYDAAVTTGGNAF